MTEDSFYLSLTSVIDKMKEKNIDLNSCHVWRKRLNTLNYVDKHILINYKIKLEWTDLQRMERFKSTQCRHLLM